MLQPRTDLLSDGIGESCRRPERNQDDYPKTVCTRITRAILWARLRKCGLSPAGDFATNTSPLCHSMERLTIASPSPNPVLLTPVDPSCTNKLNTLCPSFPGIPGHHRRPAIDLECNRILGVSNAQCRPVDYQAQLQMTRLDADWKDHRCFGLRQ
jgi:hypothetical protein